MQMNTISIGQSVYWRFDNVQHKDLFELLGKLNLLAEEVRIAKNLGENHRQTDEKWIH